MYEIPKCYICGKFISIKPEFRLITWDSKLIWTSGVVPEPNYDIFWHIKCKEK